MPTRTLLRRSESLSAIARTGLGFTESLYEQERFEEILRVAADIRAVADEDAPGLDDGADRLFERVRGHPAADVAALVLSNAAALDHDYAYMNLPIEIWSCAQGATCSGGASPTGWTSVTADANNNTIGNNGTSYLTLSNGYLSFLLPANAVYEFAIPKGGSFYTISSDTTTGNLSPSYIVNVQSAG